MDTIKRTYTNADGTYGEALSTINRSGDKATVSTRIVIVTPDGKKKVKTIQSEEESYSQSFSFSGFESGNNQGEIDYDESNVKSDEENVNEFFRMTNEFREQNGKSPLVLVNELSEIAKTHNDAMIAGTRPFGHEGVADRFKLIPNAKNTAENCSFSFGNKDYLGTLFTNLVNSKFHKANMLGDFTRIGIVIGRTPDHKWYVTQLFADN